MIRRTGSARPARLPGLVAVVALASLVAALPPGAGGAAAQDPVPRDLAALVRGAGADRVTFAFPARDGVCRAGDAILIVEPDGTSSLMSGHWSGDEWRGWRSGEAPCQVGDIVVEATRTGAGLAAVRVRVGAPGLPMGGADLGRVAGQQAADYLLGLAATAASRDARQLILAAALAGEAVRWPALLRLARDRQLPQRTRKSALRWLGREAAAEAARELGGIVRDRTEADEIRESAVFGLSQLPADQAVDLLIEVVRDVPDARVRSRALFWLAEFDDPRALALFEEILSQG